MANQHTSRVMTRVFNSPVFNLNRLRGPQDWNVERPCWYCGICFTPRAPKYWQQHFCQEDHRKSFNKYGAVTYEKLFVSLREEFLKMLEPLEARIAELEKKMEKR